ncbi:MAG: TonB-dependent receptor, partial [Mycobacterium sp.]|uniref:TonB-dependent receptor n=1 Tax=Mycobacterium sp. TaxID=1785 RepID=UPI001ED18621
VLIAAATATLGFAPGARAATATAAATDTTAATGQGTTSLSEVVVQARRSSENLQRVPVAVTVVTPKAIDSAGVFEPTTLANLTPGLTVPATISDRENVVYTIRGQSYSYSNQFNAVLTYLNDVPVTQIDHGMFFDLDNVQILRGPQGTQFGRVTDGGNVMLYPKRPSNQFDGYVEGKVGDYNLRDVTAALNIPVIPDKLMIRGAMDLSRRDGFTQNLVTGKDLDNVNYDAFRVGIIIKPTENLENYTSVSWEHTNENGTSVEPEYINQTPLTANALGIASLFPGLYSLNALGDVVGVQAGLTPFTGPNYLASLEHMVSRQLALGPRATFETGPVFDRRDNIFVTNTTTWDLHFLTVKNIFGYIFTKDDEAQDFLGGSGAVVRPCHSACPNGAPNIPLISQEQFSEEFRLSGKVFDDRLTWSAGAYTDAQKNAGPSENNTIGFGVFQRTNVALIKTWEVAGYGNVEYDLHDFLPGLKINGGVRYSSDSNHSDVNTYILPEPSPLLPAAFTTVPHSVCIDLPTAPCVHVRAQFHAFTYTAGASYQFSPNQMIYAKVSRGYRPGGVAGAAPTGVDPRYQPEGDLSVEVGAKADFDIHGVKLRTNIALFHDDYTKIQQNVNLPPQNGQAVAVVKNVDDAVYQGVEFEGTLIPFQGMTIGVNYAYFAGHYKPLPTDPLTNPTSPCNPNAFLVAGYCSANAVGYMPRNEVGLNADYDLPLDPAIGTVTIGATWHYQTKTWLTLVSRLNPYSLQPAYNTLDLRATWHGIFGHPIDASFFMTNLTNQLYRIGSDDLSPASQIGIASSIYGPPRMFGFGLKYRFGVSGS